MALGLGPLISVSFVQMTYNFFMQGNEFLQSIYPEELKIKDMQTFQDLTHVYLLLQMEGGRLKI